MGQFSIDNKMPKINFEKIIKAERKKVFDIVANYELFEKTLPQYFPSIRIRSKRNDVAVVEEHRRVAGKELIMMTRHVINYPKTHEVFVIGGDTKGSHIVEKYETISEGTKIIVEADIKLNGTLKMIEFFGKGKILKSFSKVIDEFAKIAEN